MAVSSNSATMPKTLAIPRQKWQQTARPPNHTFALRPKQPPRLGRPENHPLLLKSKKMQ
jgi:hypothetical protein